MTLNKRQIFGPVVACVVTCALLAAADPPVSAPQSTDAPWKVNTPIVSVQKKLYRKYPKPGAAAMVKVDYVGPNLQRQEIHSLEIRDDVPQDSGRRISLDNGRTWSKFEPIPPTLSYPNKVEVWEGLGCLVYDPTSSLLVAAWLRQINVGGLYHNFTYTRTSADLFCALEFDNLRDMVRRIISGFSEGK